MAKPKTVNEYINGFPPDARKKLREIRQTIQKAAPNAKETVKYGMPTYMLDGNLVYFAGYKRHIAIYPAPIAAGSLSKELKPYLAHKSTLQFPLDKPMPLSLISKVVKTLAEQRAQVSRKK
jgi:uncharacterized protein YdhG (YjbR/CyaY superfamily)